jgi:hypothetical protein
MVSRQVLFQSSSVTNRLARSLAGWQGLYPEFLILRVSGAKEVIVPQPIFTRRHTLDGPHRQFAQLAGTRQAGIQNNVVQAEFLYRLNISSDLLTSLPDLTEDDQHPVAQTQGGISYSFQAGTRLSRSTPFGREAIPSFISSMLEPELPASMKTHDLPLATAASR